MSRAVTLKSAAALALAFLLTIPAPILAQTQTGSILVRVVDEQGGLMPGANVTIRSPTIISETIQASRTLAA